MDDSYYAIVIPICETNDRCKPLLDTLLTSIQWGHYTCPVVCLWDNCSKEFIEYFEKSYSFITSMPYFGEKNLNFAKNSNRGLRYVYEELHMGAFLVNMDTCLPSREHLEKITNAGISSPRGEHIEGTVQQKTYRLNQVADPGCPCNKNKPKLPEPSNKFAAFCMWISKYAFSKIGYLDDITFTASFEDDDMCVRACLANLPCEIYPITVHHELDPKERETQISTTGSYDMAQLMDHLAKFYKKWSIPYGITHADFASYILKTYKWDDKWKVH